MAARAGGGGNPGDRDSKVAGFCGIVLGILFIAAYATAINFPFSPSQADATLAGFSSVRTSFLVAGVFIGLAATFAIPYYSTLRHAFAGKEALLVDAATLFSIVGMVVTAVVFIGQTVALSVLADAYAAGGQSRTSAVVVAQTVIGAGGMLTFGFLLLAAGLAIYGFLMTRGKGFPAWLGYAGMTGAVLFVVGSLPFDAAFYAFIAGFVIFLAWIFLASAFLWGPAALMKGR